MPITEREATRLNRSMPVAKSVRLGDIIRELQMREESGVPDGGITTEKIADEAVTTEKLSSNAKAPFAGHADEAGAVDWQNVSNKPSQFPPSAHTHPIAQVDGLQDALDGKLSEIEDGSITVAKLAQDVITRIDEHKFTPLIGSNNNANNITEPGIYFNIGGYVLQNAPRGNYGWVLIVTRGESNGHHRGAQVYLDHDGFDWRGFDGNTFTDWETCIIKNKIMDVEPTADPSTATAEDVATKLNEILAALKS